MANGGWTNKTLRVDLTSGKITSEDTLAKYQDWMGGTGVGYKVIWDEVPAKTAAFAPENKIIVGVGPLTGSGAPSGGRTSITTIWPSSVPVELVATGHMGGHFGAEARSSPAGTTSSLRARALSPCGYASTTTKSVSRTRANSGAMASIVRPLKLPN